MWSAIQLFQCSWHVSQNLTKSLILTNIVQYMENMYNIICISIILYIIIYKYAFINKYFTHLYKMLVDELVHNKGYEGHSSLPHYFDSDFGFD